MVVRKAIREAFAACSTCDVHSYYSSKGEAIEKFECALREGNYRFMDYPDFGGDSGHCVIAITTEEGKLSGYAYITWYRIDKNGFEYTGCGKKYEFIGYIT